jgi:hypothetical protein
MPESPIAHVHRVLEHSPRGCLSQSVSGGDDSDVSVGDAQDASGLVNGQRQDVSLPVLERCDLYDCVGPSFETAVTRTLLTRTDAGVDRLQRKDNMLVSMNDPQ